MQKVNLTEKKYIGVIDISTILFHSALAGQRTVLTIKHKETGHVMLMDREIEVKEGEVLPTDKRISMSENIQGETLWTVIRKTPFNNVSEFYGRFKGDDKIGGWLKDFNDRREAEGKPLMKKSDFEIEETIELIEDYEKVVKGRFKQKIQAFLDLPWCKDIIICYAEGKCFRYDVAKTQPYKAGRKDKPLAFDVVVAYMKARYQDKIKTIYNAEDDDAYSQIVYKDWIEAKGDINKLTKVGISIDKDLRQVSHLWFNFDKFEEGVRYIDPFEACYNFCFQLLVGDQTDNIGGLMSLPSDFLKERDLRNTKGLGEKTAMALLEPCKTQKELFQAVVDCYKATYGEGLHDFTDYEGNISQRTWLDELDEQAQLLRMVVIPNQRYKIEDTLKRLEIIE